MLGGCAACSYCATSAASAASATSAASAASTASTASTASATPPKVPSGGGGSSGGATPVIIMPTTTRQAAGRPDSSVGAWVGVGVGVVFVMLLAVALCVICHPPLASKMPCCLAKLFEPLARLGGAKPYAAVGARTAEPEYVDGEDDDDEAPGSSPRALKGAGDDQQHM